MKIKFSVIIPVRTSTSYLSQTLAVLKSLNRDDTEVIVISDKDIPDSNDPIQIGPAYKRNLGASKAKGDYLVFLDDDSYPDSSYFVNSLKILLEHPELSGLCGPCLTPPTDNIRQQASGLVWESFIGSGGAGYYRNSISSKRFVNDYPTVNLIIKKSVFNKIGGFRTDYWPGEDTLLCREITIKYKQQILYHPSIIVYHHRRQAIVPHLQQITRYAIHRGFFARNFPETSLTIGYVIPSLFFIYNSILLSSYLISNTFFPILLLPLIIYISLILLNAAYFIIRRKNILSIFLFVPTVYLTHLYYGFLFIKGFFSSKLALTPHRTDNRTGNYIGG